MARRGNGEGYTKAEAQRRFEQALKAAVTTLPVPMKDRLRGDVPPDRQGVGKAGPPRRPNLRTSGGKGG